MANRNAPAGFSPVSYLNGADWNGQARRYYIPSTDTSAFYIGDLVVSAEGASDGVVQGEVSIGVPQIEKAVAGGETRGVVVGIGLNVINTGQSYIPATKSQDYFIYIADDPQLIFAVQGDNSTTLATSCIGKFADFTVATPPAEGVSATVLATATIASDPSLPLRILGLYRGDFTAYATFLVALNLHELG